MKTEAIKLPLQVVQFCLFMTLEIKRRHVEFRLEKRKFIEDFKSRLVLS